MVKPVAAMSAFWNNSTDRIHNNKYFQYYSQH